MKNIIYLLAFKLINILYHFALTLQALATGFIRYIYIPIFHSDLTTQKIIDDLTKLDKRPTEQITIVYEIRGLNTIQLQLSALKIVQNGKILREGVNPTNLNCYLETKYIDKSKQIELKQIIEGLQTSQNYNMNILFAEDFKYSQPIKAQKYKVTPLVIIFSTYPSTLGLHPTYLVGAQLSFKPQVLKSTQYDLYQSLHGYASSEQRKGK